jgi:porphobilinogen deaminase
MEMMMDQEKQGDDRPIGLEKKVDEGFARVDQDIRELRREINTRLDGMQRAHYAGVVAVVAALIATGVF